MRQVLGERELGVVRLVREVRPQGGDLAGVERVGLRHEGVAGVLGRSRSGRRCPAGGRPSGRRPTWRRASSPRPTASVGPERRPAALDGEPQRRRLERLAQLADLHHLRRREREHARAALRVDAHQPLQPEPRQRLADRGLGDVQHLRERALGERLAQPEVAGDDRVADLHERALGQRARALDRAHRPLRDTPSAAHFRVSPPFRVSSLFPVRTLREPRYRSRC